MDMLQVRNTLLLVLAAAIWGFAFVAQSMGAEHVGTYTFLASRTWFAVAALLPLVLIRLKRQDAPQSPSQRKGLLFAGFLCGLFLFTASVAQQAGIPLTTTAKAGFITALYVIFVPLAAIVLGKRVRPLVLGCAVLATVGLYLLCIKDELALSSGDSLVLLCALLFTGHIMVIDRFAAGYDGVILSELQFVVVGIFSTICMFLFETPDLASLKAAFWPIAYAGVFSSAVGYTLQIVGQKGLHPAVAGVAMSLESVFSALGGWLMLDQTLTGREFLGCGLMFAAIIVAQLPDPPFLRRKD